MQVNGTETCLTVPPGQTYVTVGPCETTDVKDFATQFWSVKRNADNSFPLTFIGNNFPVAGASGHYITSFPYLGGNQVANGTCAFDGCGIST